MSEVLAEGLCRCYPGVDVPAVDHVDLMAREGEFLTLLGPSGCGKTTVLRAVAGLDRPDGGRISIGGEPVSDAARQFFVAPHRRRLGMVFQSYALWPHMNVFGNVAYALKLQRLDRGEIVRRVEESLALVGLDRMAGRDIGQLSGGQQQRVALARAIAARPRVLLMDEPLSNLDAALRGQMQRELRRIHRETGTTTLYVTHDQSEALSLSDRIVVMRAGRVLQCGTPPEVFGSPSSRWLAEFVGFDNFVPATMLMPGGRGLLAVRSSSFRLEPVSDAAALRGEVREVVYMGSAVDVVVDVAGQRITARLDPGASPRPGESLSLFVRPAHAVALEDAA